MMNIKSQLSCAFAFLPWFYQHCFAQNLQYFILSASFPKNYTTNTYHNEFPKSHLQIPWQSNSICRSYAKASFRCGQKCFSNWRRHSYRYSYGRGICQSKSRPHLLNWKKTQPSYRSRRKKSVIEHRPLAGHASNIYHSSRKLTPKQNSMPFKLILRRKMKLKASSKRSTKSAFLTS